MRPGHGSGYGGVPARGYFPMSVPSTMRASVLREAGEIRVEERPVPEPGRNDVLVRVGAVGTCGSDTHYFEHGRIGPFVVRAPLVLGHEAMGTVVACGAGVERLSPGDRVSLEPGVPDGVCAQCRAGRYNLCPRVRFMATPPVDGAFCEYVAWDANFAHPVPDTLSDEAAALLEPLSVGVWACRKTRVGPGDRALVTGAGPIGLVTAQTARAFGATDVTVTDVGPHRLAAARRSGATRTVDVGERSLAGAGVRADVLVECSGVAPAASEAVSQVDPAGRVVLVRQHLADRDRAGGLGRGGPGLVGHAPVRSGAGRVGADGVTEGAGGAQGSGVPVGLRAAPGNENMFQSGVRFRICESTST